MLQSQSIEDRENCVLDCPESMSCAAQTCCRREAPKLSTQNAQNGCDIPGGAAVRRRTNNKISEELLDIPLTDIDHGNGSGSGTSGSDGSTAGQSANQSSFGGPDPNESSVKVNLF